VARIGHSIVVKLCKLPPAILFYFVGSAVCVLVISCGWGDPPSLLSIRNLALLGIPKTKALVAIVWLGRCRLSQCHHKAKCDNAILRIYLAWCAWPKGPTILRAKVVDLFAVKKFPENCVSCANANSTRCFPILKWRQHWWVVRVILALFGCVLQALISAVKVK